MYELRITPKTGRKQPLTLGFDYSLDGAKMDVDFLAAFLRALNGPTMTFEIREGNRTVIATDGRKGLCDADFSAIEARLDALEVEIERMQETPER